MKFLNIVLVAMAALAAGCVFVPSPYSEQLKPVGKHYSSIQSGSSRLEIEAQLGSPNRTEDDGSSVWETRIDDLNYARVRIWFNADSQAQKVEVTQAHGTRRAGYHASAMSTRIK